MAEGLPEGKEGIPLPESQVQKGMDGVAHIISLLTLSLLFLLFGNEVGATVFTLVNKCENTVWPGILPDAGMQGGGFALQPGQSQTLSPPGGWSGRIWGRTGCNFDGSGHGACETGDCGNALECNDVGGSPPVSLVEFTLGDKDFYDVSLVDGYNLPLSITPSNGAGDCRPTGCDSDLRDKCPRELAVEAHGQVIACKSACDAFNSAEYCCTGDHGSPATCPPTKYSEAFKNACPTAYSYAYDDSTSTFTCSGADYALIFCPNTSG
eukprot:Gb_35027 [translate_table: standard]